MATLASRASSCLNYSNIYQLANLGSNHRIGHILLHRHWVRLHLPKHLLHLRILEDAHCFWILCNSLLHILRHFLASTRGSAPTCRLAHLQTSLSVLVPWLEIQHLLERIRGLGKVFQTIVHLSESRVCFHILWVELYRFLCIGNTKLQLIKFLVASRAVVPSLGVFRVAFDGLRVHLQSIAVIPFPEHCISLGFSFGTFDRINVCELFLLL
mmetsp:Transcript_19072/g.36951  ORF Transcript_19072/g.36951 Transcript_19072/m.36951 type:complete len:212 (-) Transcript_19072:716-1351(-)